MPLPSRRSSPSSATSKKTVSLAALAREKLAAIEEAERLRLREEAIARSRKRNVPMLDFVCGSRVGYLPGWVHELICRELEEFSAAVARGESPRLMLFMPPQHGKSFLSSERFPVWHLGHYTNHHIVVASYGQAHSNRFSRSARRLVADKKTREVFPELELSREHAAVAHWETTDGGSYKAVGVGGALTGSPAHIIVLDDIVKDQSQADSETHRENAWDWYSSTAYTRLAPGGGILVLCTRWHEDDLAGRLLKVAADDPDSRQWRVIRFAAIAEEDEYELPDGRVAPLSEASKVVDFVQAKAKLVRKEGEALHPQRYTREMLGDTKRGISARWWFALYQQRPTSAEGTMFKRAWWQWYTKRPAKFDRLIQSWDFSFDDTEGADYVVGQVWGVRDAEYYLLDQVRGRMDAPASLAAVLSLSAKWPAARAKLIEKKANGAAIMKLLKRKVSGFIAIEPQGSKAIRASAVSPDVESGNVFLPEGAPWVHDFVEELAAFPKAANDDQVDATTQALIYLTGNKSATEKLNKILGRGRRSA